jgi:hypothetical protein
MSLRSATHNAYLYLAVVFAALVVLGILEVFHKIKLDGRFSFISSPLAGGD